MASGRGTDGVYPAGPDGVTVVVRSAESRMPMRVDAYIETGVASGVLARSGYLRDVLEAGGDILLERVSWQGLGDAEGRAIPEIRLPIDDVLVAVADDDPTIAVHASWHALSLEVGPYRVEGEMPTLPGYDPGRALARPTGEFVMLRDARLAVGLEGSRWLPVGRYALVNRYAVERVAADIMLGFFFPGADIGSPATDAPETAASTPSTPAGPAAPTAG